MSASGPVSRSVGSSGGPLLAAAVAVGVLVAAWSALYRDVGSGRLIALGLVALVPAVITGIPRWRPATMTLAVLSVVSVSLALATRASLWEVITLDGDAWGTVRAILPDGVAAGSDASLPVSPVDQPALVALLDVALVALCAVAAWQIARRGRPVAGLAIIAVGLAYRWTVEPPSSGGVAGASALAAAILVLALSSWDPGAAVRPLRRVGGVVILGGLTIGVAAGLGAGPAQSGEPWWSWKQWDLGGISGSTSGGSLDIRQGYPTLDWPSTARVALLVETDRPRPLRAVSLTGFDGISFVFEEPAGSSRALPVLGGAIVLPESGTVGESVTQRVTVAQTTSSVVLASGRPERIVGSLPGAADLIDGAIRLQSPLRSGDRYLVRTRIPRATAGDLVRAGAYASAPVPPGSTRLRPGLYEPPIDVPLWGSTTRPRGIPELGPYARIQNLAIEVAGDARTPYAAVNRIEAHLRSNYVYDEEPPYPTSLPGGSVIDPEVDPPLVDFLFSSRRGFCQHFAGSMAVMLRSVGIPARVAVGYTGGRYDAESGSWRVLDRDAHSWVEVWFPNKGWLPFDPTPGRSAPNAASVSSPDYAPTRNEIDLGGIADRAVSPAEPSGPAPDPRPESAPAPVAPQGSGAPGGGGGDWRWGLLALPAFLAAAPAARMIRRLRGRRGGDERSRVIAASRELEAGLAPLGWAPSRAASATERAAEIYARTGVDASELYRRAAIARFSPAAPPPGEAAAAWRQLRTLRRALRRSAPRGRRMAATLGLRRAVRDTVG